MGKSARNAHLNKASQKLTHYDKPPTAFGGLSANAYTKRLLFDVLARWEAPEHPKDARELRSLWKTQETRLESYAICDPRRLKYGNALVLGLVLIQA